MKSAFTMPGQADRHTDAERMQFHFHSIMIMWRVGNEFILSFEVIGNVFFGRSLGSVWVVGLMASRGHYGWLDG